MTCNHTDTVAWFPNDGHPDGEGMVIRTPNGPLLSLTLCRTCGITFDPISPKSKARRTAATLRTLLEKVKK